MIPRPRLVVLDLDGTLVDSVPDLCDAVNTMLQRLGRPAVSEQRLRGWIGNGAAMLVQRALGGEQGPAVAAADFDMAFPMFVEAYESNVSARSRLYPGIREGLERLRADGFHLACITNKPSCFTIPLLRDLGVAPFFEQVGCGDQFQHLKPHPEALWKTARHFGLEPGQCLMVGDSVNDVQAARSAGYAIVCVTYGYHNREDVRELEADAYIDSLTQLPELFAATAA